MRWRTQTIVMMGVLGCAAIALLIFAVQDWNFERRWNAIHPGMSEAEVIDLMGTPVRRGTMGLVGAGGKSPISWDYERGQWTYTVAYDYIGPSGSPEVFKKTRTHTNWDSYWLSWWPWQ